MQAEAAPINAHSAQSSTYRDANHVSDSADDVEHLMRLNWAQGIHKFFITDDNFARNKEWESIFDRLILLREKTAIPLGLMIQVDTLCHKIPNFIEKAKRAGVTRVFIGLEKSIRTISPLPRNGRTRSPNTETCCWPGRRRASSPLRATF